MSGAPANETTAEQFQAMLEQAEREKLAKGKGGDVDMSPEEFKKFKNAFEDPEFRRMFSEYVDEMSDPKNRAENEMYISQLEGEQKVPQGKELIRPSASFVAKTHKLGKDASDKTEKIWMNIVQSEKIAEPSKEKRPEGESWSLPYSVGPPHMEKDTKDANVATFDCCFHPTAIAISKERKEFRDLLVSTAMEGIEEAFKRQGRPTSLSKEFHILKGVSYKSGQIPAMMVDVSSKLRWKGEPEADEPAVAAGGARNPPAPTPAPAAAPAATAAKETKEPAIKKGFLNKDSDGTAKAKPGLIQEVGVGHTSAKTPVATPAVAPAPASRTLASTTTTPSGPLEPSYTIKERGNVSWGDFEQMRSDANRPPQSTRPAELVVRIEIPKVASMADVELEVSERRLVMNSKAVYSLTLALPYPVDDKKGSAKYDKTAKCLNVTLPVKPPQAPPPKAVSSDDDPSVSLPSPPKASPVDSPQPELSSPPSSSPTGETKGPEHKKELHRRWVSETSEEEKKSAERLKEEIKKQADETLLNAPPPQPPAPKSADAVAVSDVVGTQPSSEPFVPSATFAGKREGYVFKRGDQGVGYYKDSKRAFTPSTRSQNADTSSAAAPAQSSEQTSCKDFPFEYRQTAVAVAVLVQVPGIIPTSATVTFSTHLVSVKFQTDTQAYALDLKMSNEIVPEASKFDIVPRNMCLVLAKRNEAMWDDEGEPIVTGVAYTGTGIESKASSATVDATSEALKSLESMSFTSGSDLIFELD